VPPVVPRTAPVVSQCLFCANNPNSKEHAWPNWLLKMRKDKNWGPIRRSVEGLPVEITASAEVKIKAVCQICNNGWMSRLETENKSLIGGLLNDLSLPLDTSHQTSLARWTLKTAMVLDAVTKERNRFYTRSECETLHLNSVIPALTTIWVGRYYRSHLSLDGMEVWIDLPETPKVAKVCVTTIVVGHLAIQFFTVHVLPEHKDKEIRGPVSMVPETLLEIWPSSTRPVNWPPPVSFTDNGPTSIRLLFARWRTGGEAPPNTPTRT
jgi:hypothetical protein